MGKFHRQPRPGYRGSGVARADAALPLTLAKTERQFKWYNPWEEPQSDVLPLLGFCNLHDCSIIDDVESFKVSLHRETSTVGDCSDCRKTQDRHPLNHEKYSGSAEGAIFANLRLSTARLKASTKLGGTSYLALVLIGRAKSGCDFRGDNQGGY